MASSRIDGIERLGFPEALRWRDGALWFSDMFRGRVIRWTPGEEPVVVLHRERGGPEIPAGIGWMPDGTLLVVDSTRRRVLRVTGRADHPAITVHADLAAHLTHPANEMHVDPDGTAWVGGYGFDPDTDPPRPSTLVRISPDGAISVRAAPLVFPNGCERDATGSLIVAETFADRVSTLDPTADRVIAEVALPEGSGPDGISIAPDGTVVVALAFAGRVVAIRDGSVGEVYRPAAHETGPVGAYDCAVHPDGGVLAVAVASAAEGIAMQHDTGRIDLITMAGPDRSG